ncbi:DUF2190 family protein [Breoghania sp. L-A4]|uniref:DUF2190 family protein n=1 Tax=Breoghania sp. L-A4 TaxID=2304600 RepID=UPI000E35E13A|nr:DUF2190 family protein [Breoghania sp. L-A4]AXS39697.1 DUF2190 family protein [Breoghania sp. L-A4]
MQNFVQAGGTITATAPSGGATSGDGVLIDHLFGVAAITAAEGAEVELVTEGVFDIAKEAGAAFAAGAPAYWDASAKVTTPTSTGNMRIGTAIADAATTDATARVKLLGHAI